MRDTLLSPVDSSSCLARLELDIGFETGSSRVLRNRHHGPLRVQKALYPEGGAVCHAIVVHPPGGIKAGDRLEIEATVGPRAHALLTAPGATKWYRCDAGQAAQSVHLSAGREATLEWLPQETIYFDGARTLQHHCVDLDQEARYIGIEVMCFGRRASGEAFRRGEVRLHGEIRRAGQLLWHEQARITPASLQATFGLGGATVCATLIAVGAPLPAPLLAAIRALDARLGASQLKAVFIARLVCDDSEHARAVMTAAWRLLRPHLTGRAATPPRIWAT